MRRSRRRCAPSGYQTGFIGKYLNGYGAQRSKVTGKSSFRYVPNGWTDWYGAVSRPPRSGYKAGGTYNYMHTLFNVNGRIDDTHRGEYQTDVLGQFARKLVTKYHRSPRPFFLYLSSVAPHFGTPYEKGDPTHLRRTGGGYTNIATPARPTWVRGMFDKQVTRAPGLPANGGPSEADISDKARPMRWAAEPSAAERAGIRNLTRQRAESLYVLDREVARLVSRLKTTGEYANTVFMFTSDNGYFLGEHRQRQGKIKPHEPSLRVPFVVAGRGIPHGERFDPITTPGVTATIAELAGATSRMPYAAGRGLRGPLAGPRPRLVRAGGHRGARVRQRVPEAARVEGRRFPRRPQHDRGAHRAVEVRPLLHRRRRALRPRQRPERAGQPDTGPRLRRRPRRASTRSGWTTGTASERPAGRRSRNGSCGLPRRTRPGRTCSPWVCSVAMATGASWSDERWLRPSKPAMLLRRAVT